MRLDPERNLSIATVELMSAWASGIAKPTDRETEETLALFANGLLEATESERVLTRLIESAALREQLISVISKCRAASNEPAVGLLQRIVTRLLTAEQVSTGVVRSLLANLEATVRLENRLLKTAAFREGPNSTIEIIGLVDGRISVRAILQSEAYDGKVVWLDYVNGVPFLSTHVEGRTANFEGAAPSWLSAHALRLRLDSATPQLSEARELLVEVEPDGAARLSLIGAAFDGTVLRIKFRVPSGLIARYRDRNFELRFQAGSLPVLLGRWPILSWKDGQEVELAVTLGLRGDAVVFSRLLRAKICK